MEKGFIALSTVLVIMSVIVAIVATVTLLSIGEGQSSLAIFKGEDNLDLLEGCVEDAMLKARSSATFGDPVGTPVTLTRPEGSCSVTVNSKTPGVTWNMTVSNISSSDYQRKIQVIFDRNPTGITLTSWQEI